VTPKVLLLLLLVTPKVLLLLLVTPKAVLLLLVTPMVLLLLQLPQLLHDQPLLHDGLLRQFN
jgi:hypothetical protein